VAVAGNAATIKPGFEYAHRGSLFDITKGNNDLTSPVAARNAASTISA